MEHVDITIIGAGVVGLAAAYQLCGHKNNVVLLEKENGPGRGISSRNSEVIHAGIYYPELSLKAKLCVKGRTQIYEFCDRFKIPYKKTGKVIVASGHHEEASIEDLLIRGRNNGAGDLALLTRKELKAVEPAAEGTMALYSPHTGIIDTHTLTKTLEALALDNGSIMLYNTALTGLDKVHSGFICRVQDPCGKLYSFSSRIVINASGLYSDRIAYLAGIDIDKAGYKIFPVKGEYFRVSHKKNSLVKGLIYPGPLTKLTGLGIHLTKDLTGAIRLGPNAFYVDTIDYSVDDSHAVAFYESARRFLPFLDIDDLSPDMAGIRPKIQRPGGEIKDFVICHESDRNLEGLINLIGIESPGLTSCLAIGEKVRDMLKADGLI